MLPLSIHADCRYNGASHYHVRALLPAHLMPVIAKAITDNLKVVGPGAVTRIGDLVCEVFDYDIQDGEIAWAGLVIDGVNCSLHASAEALVVDMSIEKEAEGDDWLDEYDFVRANVSKLPDNYWIRPAAAVRKLLAVAQH